MFGLVVLLGLAAVVLYFRWLCSYWSRYGQDGAQPLPVIGNLYEHIIGRKHYGEIFADVYRKYPNAAWVGVQKLYNRPAVVVRDLEMVKEVLVSSFQHFNQNDFLLDEKVDPLIFNNPFILGGEKWKARRSEVAPIFSSSKVRATVPTMKKVAGKLLRYVEELRKQGPDVNVKDISNRYTIDVVAICAFSIDAESFTNPAAEFRTKGLEIFQPSFGSFIRFLFALFGPEFAALIRLPFVSQDLDQWFRKLVKHTMSDRPSSNISASVKKHDLFQALYDILSDNGTKEVGQTHLVGHTLTFMTDGFETSSTLMSFLFYELALNPDIQDRVLLEIDTVLAESNGELTDEGVQKLVYMERAMYETLRMHSAVYTLPKICTKDYELPPQYPGSKKRATLRKGEAAIIPVNAIHYDPEVFPEPNRFDPDRFLEENKKNRHRYAFLGFGEGPRICLGMKFGLNQSKIGVATLLGKYRVKLSPRQKFPLELEPTTYLKAPKNGLWVEFVDRK